MKNADAVLPPFEILPHERVSTVGVNVWQEFTLLSIKCESVNLGQGYPDFMPPEVLMRHVPKFLPSNVETAPKEVALLNQYGRSSGQPRLVEALARLYSPFFGRELDPYTNILVTAGATEGMLATVMAFLGQGDEVVVFEPFFDLYSSMIPLPGAKLRTVRLHLRGEDDGAVGDSSDFFFNESELEAAFNENTRMLILNTPHNPTGKVFSEEEIATIASIVQRYPRVFVLTDEVYEWLVYGDNVHRRMATFPGMWERTLTVCSAAKTFSVTGWKIGWVIGPHSLMSSLMRVHCSLIYCVATPLQEVLASALSDPEICQVISNISKEYVTRMQILVEILTSVGLKVIRPQGSFFVLINVTDFNLKEGIGNVMIDNCNANVKDWHISRWLTSVVGVTSIPCSVFFSNHSCTNFIRFSFCKTLETLEETRPRFQNLQHLLQRDSQSPN